MNRRNILWLLAVLFVCGITSGCSALQAPYPAKAYFLVDPGSAAGTGPLDAAQQKNVARNGESPGEGHADIILKVRQFRVAAPYDGSSFIYKTGPNQYSSDYYAGFLMPTGRMLSGEVCDWLERSGVFSHVVDSGSSVRSTFYLECNLSGFYVDLTDRRAPRAVAEAQFFLLSERDTGPQVLLARSYSTSAPVTGEGPAAYVSAWGRAWKTMLEELTADLGQNPLAATHASTTGPG